MPVTRNGLICSPPDRAKNPDPGAGRPKGRAITVSIIFDDAPREEIRQAILSPLLAHNLAVGPAPDLRRFAFLLTDAQGVQFGGLWGRTAYDWAVIELLFVPPDLRGSGLGRGLVTRAEELALARGCKGIWLDSFTFQAPDFYRKLGYEVFGELPDNPSGQSRYFLCKRLG